MASPVMPVEMIVALAMSSVALVGLLSMAVFIYSQHVSRSREAHRSQRATSHANTENTPRYISPWDHGFSPLAFQQLPQQPSQQTLQQPPQHWPLSTGPPRAHQSEHVNTGWPERRTPSRGQPSHRGLGSSQCDSTPPQRVALPSEGSYLGRRAELPPMPTHAPPLWQQQNKELHLGNDGSSGH